MSVENFFPGHYPWQRLLSDIHKKLVPEESEDDTMIIEFVMGTDGGHTTLELQITASELLEAMKTKFVVAISFIEEFNRIIVIPILYGEESADPAGYTFNGIDDSANELTFTASTASDKPLCTLV